jgi:hypothetical protein
MLCPRPLVPFRTGFFIRQPPSAGCAASSRLGCNGTLGDCIKLLLAKPIKQIPLYDIVTEPQPIFERPVPSPADAAEIAMRKDFPKG